MKLDRFKYIYQWFKNESFSSKSIKDIYNEVSQEAMYDIAVNYEHRAANFRKVLDTIQLNGDRVLDLACGTGAIEEALKYKTELKITGVDFSEGMLRVAQKRFRNNKNIVFKKDSYMDIELAANSFDLITIAHATRFIPKKREHTFIKNVYTWLKDDGYLVVFLHDDPGTKFIHFLLPKLGKHWKYNSKMHNKSTLVQEVSNYFNFIKEISHSKSALIYKEVGLIFMKKQ